MKNIFVPSNCVRIAVSDNESAYSVSSDDRFIKMICDIYDIKLCLVVHKDFPNFICLYRNSNWVAKTLPFSSFFFRSVCFKKDSINQFIPMHSTFINEYDSFQMNVDECVVALKDKMIDALGSGFNTLTEYSRCDDFGTLPCGSSESEIMMKLELMGFK
jgi:hypothetical protein